MANRDGKLILRTLKNISASISVDGGGGTKIVTELPVRIFLAGSVICKLFMRLYRNYSRKEKFL